MGAYDRQDGACWCFVNVGCRWKVMWSEGMRRTEGLSVGNVEVLKDVI